jgi:hypothetical protein
VLAAASQAACFATGRLPEGKFMKTLDLWTVIDYLPTRVPFATDKIESALNVVLTRDSENEYFTFYKATDLALSHGVVIENIDLRIKKEQPHPGFLVLTLSGACVPKAEVFSRYENLELTGYPRGRSLDEEASYSRMESWGKLSFGFSERARDCLRTVVFNPA